jgi:hypothetical protein
MTVAACDGDSAWAEGVLLKLAKDNLAIGRYARSAGLTPSDGGGIGDVGAEEGRLGRKVRSGFIMMAC